MTQDIPIKKYPQTTAEVAQMLGIHSDGQNLPMGSFPVADLPVAGLPVAQDLSQQPELHQPEPIVHKAAPAVAQPFYVKAGKALLPYAAIFLVGIFLYYFFFTKVDFTTVFKPTQSAATPQQTVIQQLEQQDILAYNKWIASYYYDVSDPKILDPESDNSGNGLTNFQKYLLNLNPKSYDTLGLGQADSQTITMGINPLTGGSETDAQKAIVSKYVDMEVVMNRLTLSNMQNPPQVAGAITPNNSAFGGNNNLTQNLSIRGTPLLNQTDTNRAAINQNQADINTGVPGLLEIPDLKIKVPVIWSKDPKNFEQDLQVGVVHYPGTAMPGEIGTMYIAGHSSNYVWAKGSYNQIFSKLGNLALNTSFKITATEQNGKTVVFNYVVTKIQQYKPTDQAQFQNTDKSVVALSTCWPVGSTAKRLVVFGTLTQTQK
jgi:LPXTG-site transpeptidase (sortase) family protein